MATEALNCLVSEARKNKFSTIGQSLNDDDVIHIWHSVSEFIEKTMMQQKGVLINGFGTFSFSQKKIEVGNNKHILIQRPVFLVSEKFAQLHGLTYTKYHSPGCIPVLNLNYAALAVGSPYERDTIESCVKEVIQAVHRSIASKKNVEFTFTGIGRLQIREGRVKMKFFRPFINSMDGSGNLAASMQNRPGTVDSVISDRAPSRLPTPNTLQLPRLAAGGDMGTMERVMPTIEEDAVEDQFMGEPGALEPLEGVQADYEVITDFARGPDRIPEPQLFDMSVRPLVPIATGISFRDDLQPPSSRLSDRHPLSKSSPAPLAPLRSSRSPQDEYKPLTPDHDFKPSSPLDHELKPPSPPAELRPVEKTQRWRASIKSPCGHYNSGQELCYLCHQRERLNVPISFAEERARKQMEEDRLLETYNELKDTEAQLKTEAEIQARRHESQKTAAFNLGVSEATKIKKHSRPTEFYPSFVFQRRPYTPPRYVKQSELNGELSKQLQDQRVKTEAQRADEKFMERLEQVQLAEDLAAQRDKYLRDKHDQREQYKRALSAQVRYKPTQIPAAQPDSAEPVFGKDDLNQEKIMERRRIAQDIYREQMDLIAQKKREEILKKLSEQKNDEEVLRRNKEDLLRDRAHRYDRMMKMRKHLENNWTNALKSKTDRQLEERRGARSPGILLHEQCDKYDRCRNCKRKLENHGQSNIWKDTRYIPGSRIIV